MVEVEADKTGSVDKEQMQEIKHIKQRLNMLDQRLDNIDSIVTAVAERVMRQPVSLYVTCPKCGKRIEIALVGSEKPTG